jgi:dipeptidyl-peptidase 4
MKEQVMNTLPIARLALLSLLVSSTLTAVAQDRLQHMPRFDRYEKLRRDVGNAVVRGDIRAEWAEDGKTFTYEFKGRRYRYDIAKRTSEDLGPPERQAQGGRGRGPERGRQFDVAWNADRKLRAFHRDRNVFIANANGSGEVQVTTEGSETDRTKFGIASWVYGEELGVREAMWWSPDSKKLAFYGFDEKDVLDYYLALDVTKIQNKLDVEAYPKAGTPNPVVTLFVYDLDSKQTSRVDTSFDGGKGTEVGHYVYSVRWSPDGDEVWFNRTNRKQNVMELCAADPATGKCRVILRETADTGWTANSPSITVLEKREKQPRRFLWMSERNGFRNLYLYDATGKLINPVTQHDFEVSSVVKVDEKAGVVYYMARSGDHPYKPQLHRVGLDGKGDKRLTDPAFSHSIQISPDNKHFLAVREKIDVPPVTKLHDMGGKVLAEVVASDTTKFEELGLRKAERITFPAADGKTEVYGYIMKPSDFDATKSYPLIVTVYGGPESGQTSERFLVPNAATELGFIVAWFDGRGTSGRGQAFRHMLYEKLGVVEIDDQAAGVKYLRERPYIDGERVGVCGTSYGGYASVMALLRHPDVFQAACASASVTDWRNYDTIYTERYMGLPDEKENKKGYDEGSAMEYAKSLKGRLMLFYGTADNNVHPSNTYQLAQALMRAGKSFEMMAGPDQGHTGINQTRMWEFFMDNLILNHPADPLRQGWDQRFPRGRKR